MAASADVRPARNYSWPPFEVGHFVPVKDGSRSPRIVESITRAVEDALIELYPWIGASRHALALSQLAGAEAVRLLLQRRLEQLALEGELEEMKARLIESAASWSNRAAKLAEGMGLTPLGEARLAAIMTTAEIGQATLADLADQGRQTKGYRAAIDADSLPDDEEVEP